MILALPSHQVEVLPRQEDPRRLGHPGGAERVPRPECGCVRKLSHSHRGQDGQQGHGKVGGYHGNKSNVQDSIFDE